MTLAFLIIVLIILGVIAWLVTIAPVINPTFKSFIVYALIVVGAILLVDWLLIASGHSPLFNLPVR